MKTFHFISVFPLLAALSLSASADTMSGRVVRILDGDTISVLDAANTEHRIRLMGIDAPEKKQPFGQKSKQNLSDLVFDQQVTVEYSKKDRYGRTIGKILVNGTDANLKQVKAGFAWHYKKYQKEQSPADRALYADAEQQARAEHLGLWTDPDPVPPWNFRHKKK